MWYEDYFKKHPYLIRQAGIGAVSVITFTVALGEHKIEAEHMIYRDDLPAHVCHYESPVTAMCYATSGSGISTSNISLTPVNLFRSFQSRV